MLPIFQDTGRSVIAVQAVPKTQTHRYGIVSIAKDATPHDRIEKMIEKPMPEQTQSNLAAVGRYILTPAIFKFLEQMQKGAGGEIQLTDAISGLLKLETVYACVLQGKRFDCGSKLGYLQATISYALKHPEIAGDFKTFLRQFFL